jgi:hypothetical protein
MKRVILAVLALAFLTGCWPLDPATIPPPKTGESTAVFGAATSEKFYNDGVGAFRTDCDYSHTNADDPLVHPDMPGESHWHNWAGNTDGDAYMTNPAAEGNSTCYGGIINRTAYWWPAMVNLHSGSPQNGFAMVPLIDADYSDALQVYYKSGYDGVTAAEVTPWPIGLRMVAGNPNSTGAQHMIRWDCLHSAHAQDAVDLDGEGGQPPLYNLDFLPQNCPAGKIIQMRVKFGQCGNGSATAPDHRSHRAYPLGWGIGGCPTSHPDPETEIIEHIRWQVGSSGAAGYVLVTDQYGAPPGSSGHADWWDGWNRQVFDEMILPNCINPGLDCRNNLLGTGWELFRNS